MSNETKMYGISNCDTIKKARNWMEKNGINYVFHDYKKSGISKEKLEMWVMQVGWETLINKRGTTFRKLPDMVKENISDDTAVMVMAENPSMIKRPVLDLGERRIIGFRPEIYAAALA